MCVALQMSQEHTHNRCINESFVCLEDVEDSVIGYNFCLFYRSCNCVLLHFTTKTKVTCIVHDYVFLYLIRLLGTVSSLLRTSNWNIGYTCSQFQKNGINIRVRMKMGYLIWRNLLDFSNYSTKVNQKKLEKCLI